MQLLTITTFTFLQFCSTSQNLVHNPSFEDIDNSFCGIMTSGDFATTLAYSYSPTLGSPDCFFDNIASSCWNFQPTSMYPGPIGLKGEQLPRTGHVMSGISLYTIQTFEQREYIQIPLSSSLNIGSKYLVECYVSLADYTESATNQFAIYLSTNPVTGFSDGVLPYTPQVIADGFITNTQGWVRIGDTLTVTEAYSYITLGNFSSDVSTPTVLNPTASELPGTYGSYYFVDDIRVERVLIDTAAAMFDFDLDRLHVSPNPFSEQIKIELPETVNAFDLQLSDSKGKILLIRKNVFGKLILPTEYLPSGIYILTLKNENGIYTKRLIK